VSSPEVSPETTDRRFNLTDARERERERRGLKGRLKGLTVSGRWGGLKNYSHSVFPLDAKLGY